jgi:iron-sulfur cluster assembly 1
MALARCATRARTTTTSARTSTSLAPLRPRPTLLALRAGLSPCRRAASTAPSAAAADAPPAAVVEQPISLTPAAMLQLERLRREEGRQAVLLRMGVRAGGCSGMSYDMKFEDEANVDADDDTVLEFPAPSGEAGALPLRVAVDGKSLLFLFGMQVDYSDALVGGGFKFINPQATDTCGCGKSFAA